MSNFDITPGRPKTALLKIIARPVSAIFPRIVMP